MAVESAIVFINGFRQGIGPGVGLQGMYFQATRMWFDRRLDLVLHRTWDANHKETADLILSHCPQKVYVVGYSYGCGWGLTKLAEALEALGRCVDAAFMVDPVTRYKVARWRSLGWLARRSKLIYRIPGNVREAYSWRQVNRGRATEPVGHRVEAENPGTIVHPEVVMGGASAIELRSPDTPVRFRRICLDCSHYTIDSNPVVQREVLGILSELNPPPKE